MKRLLLIIITLAAVSMSVPAKNYQYLVIERLEGERAEIKASTLKKLTFEGEDLIVTTSSGEKSVFSLAELKEIYFSDISTAVSNAARDDKRFAAKVIYSLDGRTLREAPLRGLFIIREGEEVKKINK